MTRLVWKDIVIARWFLMVLIPFYALQLAVSLSLGHIFFLWTLIFTLLLGFGSIGLEDLQGTESLCCSLPVSRRDVVLARYLSTSLGLFLGVAMSWLVSRGAPLLGIAGTGRNSLSSAVLLGHAFLLILLVLLAAVFLPCYFRFGAGKGLMVFSALGAGGLIVLPLLVQLALFLAGIANPLLDPELWREKAAEFGAEERERLARWSIGVMLVLASAAVVLSAGLSVRFYEKRDL